MGGRELIMNWNKGFKATYYASFVDPNSWRDTERFKLTGGSVKRSDSNLMNSADLSCKDYDQTTERWVRVWLNAEQSGAYSHDAIFTGLAIAPEKDFEGSRVSKPLTCYSVLKPAQDILLPLGWYAPAGVSGAQLVKQLLSEGTPAPIVVDGISPPLSQYIVAEENENRLSMSLKILNAIGWRLRIDGMGEITVCGLATSPSARFDPLENDSIEPKLKLVNDGFSCPNVFRAVMDDTSAEARDDSEQSPLSVPVRGREVWKEERDCNLNADETLAEYAQRRLKEEQRSYLAVSYTRRFRPDVVASDLVQLHYPAQGLEGLYYVSSQSISLSYGASTAEEVVQV